VDSPLEHSVNESEQKQLSKTTVNDFNSFILKKKELVLLNNPNEAEQSYNHAADNTSVLLFSSDLRVATVDGQLGAQDEGGLVRQQEGHVASDLVDASGSAHGYLRLRHVFQ